jgi:phosphatidylinositol alpha-1,6-mannosyltransferase
MNILFLSWNYPPARGGIEYVVENLFHCLAGKNSVRLLTAHAGVSAPEPNVERAPKRGIPAFLAFALRRGWSLCRREEPDAILCGTVVSAPAAVLLSWQFRIPFVVLVHGSDILYPGWFYQKAVRWLLRRATRLAANSNQTRNLLVAQGFDPSRIEVIYPGVRIDDFLHSQSHENPELAALTAGRRVLLTVGRIIRRKGVLEFVEHVMPELVKTVPDILYLVVGDDAKASLVHKERLRDRINASVQTLGLQRNVRLLGTLSDKDLVSLYGRAHLFVLPCLDIPGDVEGFGIVFSEAALAGMPSVSTRVGGIPEAVLDGKTGLLVNPGDHAAMRNAIERLLLDEPLRRRLAQGGTERARAELAWPVIAAQYESLLVNCVR